jgi:hypothetical protein
MGDVEIFFLVVLSALTLLDILLTVLVIALCRRAGCCPDPGPEHDRHPMESIE